jgi:hypothetical protein
MNYEFPTTLPVDFEVFLGGVGVIPNSEFQTPNSSMGYK